MKKLRIIVLAAMVLLTASASFGQSKASENEEKKAILAVIDWFFQAMTARDAAAYEKTLVPEGRVFAFQVAKEKNSMWTRLNSDDVASLSKGKEVLVERIWDPEVKIRGPIANVWTPYDFWIDGKFSHCGIDSFDLVKVDGQWKISGILYTVEMECKPSPLGPLKK